MTKMSHHEQNKSKRSPYRAELIFCHGKINIMFCRNTRKTQYKTNGGKNETKIQQNLLKKVQQMDGKPKLQGDTLYSP